MIPQTIRKQLLGLRRRELLLRLAWGAARWLGVVFLVLVGGCLLDYAIDRSQDTPASVRVLLFVLQVAVASGFGFVFLIRPLMRRPSESELALWVEETLPAFQHRLITAVQLNRPGARTEGMSPELIAVVTHEAEVQARQAAFAALADHRRLAWSAGLAAPVLASALLILVLVPLAPILLARQFLADLEVPRNVHVESISRTVWPSGERVVLEFRATGEAIDEHLQGEVVLDPVGQSRVRYPLRFARFVKGAAIYAAQVPPSSDDFVYHAYLGDGRKNRAGEVRFVPRPVVTEIAAWVQLPVSCGIKPAAKQDDLSSRRYEVPQIGGDLAAIPGSAARLRIKLQKPVELAEIHLLGAHSGESIRLQLDDTGRGATGTFPLSKALTGYQIFVVDEHGFGNQPAPRRSIKIVPEEPPRVTLLPVSFPDPSAAVVFEEDVLEGMPLPPGGPLPIAYTCEHPYGLGQARLLYRFPQKMASGEMSGEEEPWHPLELNEIQGTPQTGPFLPQLGRFAKSRSQVPFHAVPSPDPQQILGRTLGGGRFVLQTEKLFAQGRQVTLKPGDQIEICVEVFAGKPGDGRPSARSEPRVISIVSWDDWDQWRRDVQAEEERLRKLDQKQRGVFDGK